MPARKDVLFHVVMIVFLLASCLLLDVKKYYFYLVAHYGYFAAALAVFLLAVVFALLSRVFGRLYQEQISPPGSNAPHDDADEPRVPTGDRD
jgi:hypothetical protein